MTDWNAECPCTRCTALRALLATRTQQNAPQRPLRPTWAEQDPVYRQAMIDSGHGAYLP